jgi:hypothetical protein
VCRIAQEKRIIMKFYMAIDQYGKHYDGLTHPRKELTEKIGCKHVDKMYVDTTSGKSYHTGYVIGGYWLSIYEVIPMRKDF